MRDLLGLSLTVDSVAWTLVDPADGTIVADDVVEVHSADNVANAAATSVEAFAAQTERDIDAVRIAWSEGAAGSAVQLSSKLRSLGFGDIDVMSEDDARDSRNRTARYIDPPLELAYGAARSVTDEAYDRLLRRMSAQLPARRISKGVASGIVVMAVGAVAAGYLLLDRAPSHAADHASAPAASAAPPVAAHVVAGVAAALPPPPAPQVALAPTPPAPQAAVPQPVVLVLPVEESAPAVIDEPVAATVPDTAALTVTAPTPAQAPETVPLPGTAAAAASTVADQPHLTPEALSARLLPGPVSPVPVAGPAPIPALPPPPNPLDILAALP